MTRAPRYRFTPAEIAIVVEVFPTLGAKACAERLPSRSINSIRQRAWRMGLSDPKSGSAAAAIDGERVLEVRAQGLSFAKIGAQLGVCEASATNAWSKAACIAAGGTPAKRDSSGALMAREVKRMRGLMLDGRKNCEIALLMAVSASQVTHQRRRFEAELRAQRKGRTLPPPGGGAAYSGRKLSKEQRAAVQALFMEGFGTAKVSDRTGVSRSQCIRIRKRLVKRLARKGECLPGCDRDGRRKVMHQHRRRIPDEAVAALRGLLLERWPVSRAAKHLGIGGCAAYRIRDALAAELAAQGQVLPKPILPGRDRTESSRADWLPADRRRQFRLLSNDVGMAEAKRRILAEIAMAMSAAPPKRRLSFEEQLAAAAAGARIETRVALMRPPPAMTLGGVATGAL